jgi:DNA processing protein
MSESPVCVAEKVALLNLLAIDGIGSGTVLKLVEQFGTAQAVFEASEASLNQLPRFSQTLVARLKTAKADGEIGKRQFHDATQSGVEIRTFWDPDYPPLLRELESDSPAILFVRGSFEPDARRLAVVGTRSSTAYGKRVTHDLIAGLRNSGVHIVSGLASGIDGFAHETALEVGLPTQAIFGCGVDRIYPPVHTGLANRILASGGALISEYPLGTIPDRHHFPQRNRIIAGLARGTLVVEAGDKSGALITAMLAAEYNREVMAVPGAITNPKATGCHSLIKTGAALVERSEEILQLLEVRTRGGKVDTTGQAAIVLAESESTVVNVLDATEARHIDSIAQRLGVPVGEALGQLLLLELKGAVIQLPGKYFVRA